MQEYYAGEIDVAVIGGGHAGCEAALASAKKAKRPLVCLGSLYTYKDLMEYIENT